MTDTQTSPYVIFSDAYPSIDPFLMKLEETANLSYGWRFGKGLPPAKRAVAVARTLYQEFSFLRLKADIFPGVDGSLSLIFYVDETCVELDISPQGTIDLYTQEGKGSDFQEVENILGAVITEVTTALVSLARKEGQWHLLESSTQENLTLGSTGSPVNASSLTRVESP